MDPLLTTPTFTVNTITGAYTHVDGNQGKLTGLELQAVLYLVEHADRFVPQAELQERVWGYHSATASRAVDASLLRIRRKLTFGDQSPLISQYGQGVRWVSSVRKAAPEGESTHPAVERLEAAWAAGHARIEVVGPHGMGRKTLVRAWLRRHPDWAVRWDDGPWSHGASRVQVVTGECPEVPAELHIHVGTAPNPVTPTAAVISLQPPTEAEFQRSFQALARERWGDDWVPSPGNLQRIYQQTLGIPALVDCAVACRRKCGCRAGNRLGSASGGGVAAIAPGGSMVVPATSDF